MKMLLLGLSKTAVGAACAISMAATAFAADMPVKAPPRISSGWLYDTVPMFGDFLGVPRLGTFKIAENESPRPTDRIFMNYSYFNDLGQPGGIGSLGLDVHRSTFGFEKTLLDGNASIGMRIPVLSFDNSNQDTEIGDISFVLKYALLNDRQSGSVFSVGLVVTAPTGNIPGSFDPFTNREIHSTLIQPYFSGLWTNGAFFLHGFSSIALPTQSNDVTMLFNDIGVGYWLYRGAPNQFISGLAPTVELHVNTPLNDNNGSLVGADTIVNVTAGTYLLLYDRYVLGVAASVPVTSPKPYDFEVLASLNIRFGDSVSQPGGLRRPR